MINIYSNKFYLTIKSLMYLFMAILYHLNLYTIVKPSVFLFYSRRTCFQSNKSTFSESQQAFHSAYEDKPVSYLVLSTEFLVTEIDTQCNWKPILVLCIVAGKDTKLLNHICMMLHHWVRLRRYLRHGKGFQAIDRIPNWFPSFSSFPADCGWVWRWQTVIFSQTGEDGIIHGYLCHELQLIFWNRLNNLTYV
jgi:hypothetical protein